MSDSPSGGVRPAWTARLERTRNVLLAAAVLFLVAGAVWHVPLWFVLAACGLVVAVALAAPVPVPGGTIPGSARDPAAAVAAPDMSPQSMLEAFPHAGFLLDGEGTVRLANSRAASLFPATRSGDPFTITFRWPEIGEALRDAIRGHSRTVEFHEPGERSSHYSVSLSPLRAGGGAGRFVLVTFDEISDRLAVARMRADFVANASHELRTPLASLTGFIETLLGPARNDPQATEKFLNIMLEQARRMRRLIDDLLSLSRVEMRVHRRPTERVDLGDVVRHVRDALGPLGGTQGVTVEVQVDERPLEVVGEHDELVQVVQNLAENAIRYGASGGRVDMRVSADPVGRHAVLDVQDYGPGIASEHVPRLTERFYRVDVGASRQMRGTGLGLAIVKHILTRHGGELRVASELGRGATFTVILPLAPPNPDNASKDV